MMRRANKAAVLTGKIIYFRQALKWKKEKEQDEQDMAG